MRAWIEITTATLGLLLSVVALFMRAWIEIFDGDKEKKNIEVALFMRAWIEIRADTFCLFSFVSPSS